ncbi:MAG: Coenzyme F420 hydrogenase/dehydrogenase, beta subunit C-terminal domain [Elusimicrobiales bacterium]|nr:Coenzyme F420 hydrogenase/dehydrogenase, beta subunit C-terminal domain [Elusimicrobiales bacterium]
MKKKKILNVCSEYCSGCGLCGSVLDVDFKTDTKGFIYPELNQSSIDLCSKVCPASGYALNNYSDGTIFGKVLMSQLGWSCDNDVRHQASSGGVLTSICLYLIRNHIVDGIIQTRKDEKDPRKTVTIVSTKEYEVLSCMGSRYSASSPLMNIRNLIEPNKKYAFIGKPCDVSALRMFQSEFYEPWVGQIEYMFSFFCAGQPSMNANNKLLKALDCDNIKDCKDLQYRGNGWPGFATVEFYDNKVNKMDYEKSWMTILGRDVRKFCRFCADGTGEYADVSCGDAWYLTADKKPDFMERPGRNVIFSRTEKGKSLMEMVVKAGYVDVEDFDIDKDELTKRQPYHYARKASLSSLKLAMQICGRKFPLYSNNVLSIFAKDFPLKSKAYRCLGTIQRVWKKVL